MATVLDSGSLCNKGPKQTTRTILPASTEETVPLLLKKSLSQLDLGAESKMSRK